MEQQSTVPQTQEGLVQNKISSFSDLFGASFKIFKDGFWKFVGLSLIPILGLIPFIVVILLFFISSQYLGNNIIVNIVLGILGLISILLAIYISLSAQAGIFIILKNYDLNPKIKDAFNEGRRLAWKFLVVNIIVVIFVFLWSLLLIIPGIIFGVYYSFSLYALIFENQESTSALKRSKILVKDYWWAVVGRYLLFSIVVLIPLFVLSIPLSFMEEGSVIFYVSDLILQIYQILAGIAYVIYGYLIYNNLVKIKGVQEKNI